MISFWRAAGIHQFTRRPEHLTSLAARTKHASCGPKLVANMPAPHGHQVGNIFEWQRFLPSKISTLLQAWSACSSPGYEILGIGGMIQSPSVTGGRGGLALGPPLSTTRGGLPMQP